MSRLQRWLVGILGGFGCLWAVVMGYAEYPNNQFDAWVMLFLGYALVQIAIRATPPNSLREEES